MLTNKNLLFSILTLITFTFAGCEVVEGIFNVGFWVGVIVVVVIVLIILWLLKKIR